MPMSAYAEYALTSSSSVIGKPPSVRLALYDVSGESVWYLELESCVLGSIPI